MNNFIKIKNLYKIFGNNTTEALNLVKTGLSKEKLLEKTNCVLGLNNINLNIPKGKIHVIMGLSGSGKSTLIRHLNRLIEPTFGEITIDGVNVLELNNKNLLEYRQKNMSMVFQKFALFPHKTILENISYGLMVQNISEQIYKEKSQFWLKRVGLEGYDNYYPNQLSGGMQQRVGLARALATDAEILLMDEAFSALDPLIRAEMQDVLIDLQLELKKTIVFITHDLDEALKIGERISILRDGFVVQDDNPQNIILNPSDDYVSDFIKDINRSRVIKAKSIMTKSVSITKENVPIIDSEMVLEEVLQEITKTKNYFVLVKDKKDKIIGRITLNELLTGIQRPRKEIKKYA
jgi:glycine betaine/proline transport system ATP-binding protein